MSNPHYDLTRARRSLAHFGVGRVLSALTGFLWLMLAVRVMTPTDYGAYVAVIAVLEIFYLVSGFGTSTIAQRYVAEYRMKASGGRLARFVWGLIAGRVVVAVVGGALIHALGPAASEAAGLTRATQWWSLVIPLALAGCVVRYLDEIFGALLLQSHAQGSTVARNLMRLVPLGLAHVMGGQVDVAEMLRIEIVASAMAALLGMILLGVYLRREAEGDPHYCVPGMWSVALRFYIVQALGQFYGSNAIKLVAARTLGLEATALLGFAQSLIDMLRNYLPAHLLAGWIRPLLVSRYVGAGDVRQLSMLSGLVLKINLLGIVPIAIFFVVAGDVFGALLSAQRYTQAGPTFALLSALLGLQTAHLMLSMVTITVEKPNASLVATALACIGMPVSWLLGGVAGVAGVVGGLIVAETIWIVTVFVSLRLQGIRLEFGIGGMRPLVPLTVFVLLLATGLRLAGVGGLAAFAGGACAAVCFVLAAVFVKPLSEEERAVVGKFVPRRLLLI